jgi:hypothetical protein
MLNKFLGFHPVYVKRPARGTWFIGFKLHGLSANIYDINRNVYETMRTDYAFIKIQSSWEIRSPKEACNFLLKVVSNLKYV